MRARSRIVEQPHEPEIHVQCLMAMKERRTRIVGDEIHIDSAESGDNYGILHHASNLLAVDAHNFERVAVQV